MGPNVKIRVTSIAPVAMRIGKQSDGDVAPSQLFPHDTGAYDRCEKQAGS